ncbi:hypothetical protein CAPTEDRAFT_191532 [Capitella teleta]|uniref:Uncharacterized protein n=1 Tax=Capitella teleta TaxID=283909 RepID=R7U2W1_CAPTE|nr:hypothetical protein CAPTEDRAFT_191532 [Capitella teleta]|eukprot:ELU00213.1 hypothetical protein CAPTEDRAFT_191532 [Capitella teleta]
MVLIRYIQSWLLRTYSSVIKTKMRVPAAIYDQLNDLAIVLENQQSVEPGPLISSLFPVCFAKIGCGQRGHQLIVADRRDNVTTATLLPDGYDIVHQPQIEGKGGGVTVVHCSCIPLGQLRLSDNLSFEAIDCLVGSAKPMRLCVVYRPLPSRFNHLSVGQFMGEFSDFLSRLMSLLGELILIEDFNFHVDAANDTNAATFAELLQSFS